MTKVEALLQELRNKGKRSTVLSRAVLKILALTKVPISSEEVRRQLLRKKYRVNKTTVYRQLHSLHQLNLIDEIQFNDRSKRFELASTESDHHHHLICLECEKVEDINFAADVERQARRITKTKHFKVLRHSLEFFGVCAECQKKR